MIAEPRNIPALHIPCTSADKERKLILLLRSMDSAVIAYSGGVDSSYLAFVASGVLGENAHCVLGLSPSVSAHQRIEAVETARDFGFRFLTINTEEMNDPAYRANATNRCYFCKTELYGKLRDYAELNDIQQILDGTNADDLGDHRPGRRAAAEKSVISPLADLGFTKSEIREMSRLHGLPGWEKPSSPCLASRIDYGVPVTIKRLGMIEQAEELIRALGCKEFRVRAHGRLARIELCERDMPKLYDRQTARRIAVEFRKLGFKFITVDLEGFRSGAMNE